MCDYVTRLNQIFRMSGILIAKNYIAYLLTSFPSMVTDPIGRFWPVADVRPARYPSALWDDFGYFGCGLTRTVHPLLVPPSVL